MARRHVLGSLYGRCDALTEEVPVFIVPIESEAEPGLAGHVDQSLGHYADAFTFHLEPDICKQLSAGYYSYSFEYEFSEPGARSSQSRIRLSSISLVARQNYTKPAPRGSLHREAKTATEETAPQP